MPFVRTLDALQALVPLEDAGSDAELLERYVSGRSGAAFAELMRRADYLAGVWAHYSKEKFKQNAEDIDSALNAAFEIGDDRLQRKARGTVVPDSFTHGTSRQRQRWFREGFETGDDSGARQLFELPYNRL